VQIAGEQEATMSPFGQQTPGKTDSASAPTRPGSPKGPPPAKMPPRKTWLWFFLIVLANFMLSRFLLPSPDAPVTVPYTLFKEEVGKRNVQAIHIRASRSLAASKPPSSTLLTVRKARPRARKARLLKVSHQPRVVGAQELPKCPRA
jgi:hypothetical protein